ncbi:hypothetical protein NPIL_39711 [Nephila pilipes]|uniref:Uncharacterized protein n=1 Tax=Nephila pilipes TaxID=299642 RepID=A0A8X6NKT5_NEPPI|nr:hypothetical protein NPIL_39711 [Nephila pilipes]
MAAFRYGADGGCQAAFKVCACGKAAFASGAGALAFGMWRRYTGYQRLLVPLWFTAFGRGAAAKRFNFGMPLLVLQNKSLVFDIARVTDIDPCTSVCCWARFYMPAKGYVPGFLVCFASMA